MNRVKSYDKFFSIEEKEQIIKDYTENYLSLRELYKKYNIGSKLWLDKLLKGKTRNASEASKIARKKYPDSFKLSEETKDKIRKAHLKWMKEHPEQTAWRLKNMSYPEKCFQEILEDNGLNKKHLIYREYSVFPYFIDFAFINEKVAVEIDGSQHLEEERKNKDAKKDILLRSNGWRIIRIAANEVTHKNPDVLQGVLKMLGDKNKIYEKVGILKSPKKKKYKKVSRGEDGLSDKERLRAFKQRRTERPGKEELSKLLQENSFNAIGRVYGVSDNAIRRWCKAYGLPHRKKDMK